MLVEHRLTVKAMCPVDKKPDLYQCIIRTPRVLPAEEILKAVEEFSNKEIFQEELTQELHRRLGVEVETVGSHSGVQTRVVCG